MDFETAKAALEKLGVEYGLEYEYRGEVGPERKSYDLPLFTSVTPPFTPEMWVSIARNTGEHYIGGCCGSSSAMQDLVCSWFRMANEGVRIRELAELAASQVEHDGEESPFHEIKDLMEKIEHLSDKERSDPWWMFALLWHITKDHFSMEKPRATVDRLSPLEKSLSIVERTCRAISWARIFERKNDDGTPEAPTSQEKAERSLMLARFLPAVKTLWEKVGDLYLGPVNGFAILESAKGTKAIAENGRGYCIFETEADVNALFDIWDEQDSHYEEQRERRPPSRERFSVRPVRVTLEEGIVFTDTGESYEGRNS